MTMNDDGWREILSGTALVALVAIALSIAIIQLDLRLVHIIAIAAVLLVPAAGAAGWLVGRRR